MSEFEPPMSGRLGVFDALGLLPQGLNEPFGPDPSAGLRLLRANAPPHVQGRARIGQVIAKVVSPCDLACDYCYEYPEDDDSWKRRPAVMPEQTVRLLGERAGEYAASYGLGSLAVTYHGGEPTIAGHTFLARSAELIRETVAAQSPQTNVEFGMQTNGVAIGLPRRGPMLLHACKEQGIQLSLSLDGDEQAHNRHRISRDGKGSYERVVRGIRHVQEAAPELFNGLLAVVDVRNDPMAVYEALLAFDPPAIDFLLPYATHDNPPLRLPYARNYEYAEWLIPIFDEWWRSGSTTDIRLFRSIINLIAGKQSKCETVGPYNGDGITVRSDGTYELVDALTMVYPGAAKTNMHLVDHSFDEVADVLTRQGFLGKKELASLCKGCPFGVGDICGGGHVATRYSAKKNYDNQSVYCKDLGRLIQHIHKQVAAELGERVAWSRHRFFTRG